MQVIHSKEDADIFVLRDCPSDATFAGVPSFGENLKRLRERAGLRGVDFAAKLGVGSSQVSKWETGRIESPDTTTLMKIGVVLNATIDELVAGADADYETVRIARMRESFYALHGEQSKLLEMIADGLRTGIVDSETVALLRGIAGLAMSPSDRALRLAEVFDHLPPDDQKLVVRMMGALAGDEKLDPVPAVDALAEDRNSRE